jgi:RNA polymerase sigma factor, sigma-70 family
MVLKNKTKENVTKERKTKKKNLSIDNQIDDDFDVNDDLNNDEPIENIEDLDDDDEEKYLDDYSETNKNILYEDDPDLKQAEKEAKEKGKNLDHVKIMKDYEQGNLIIESSKEAICSLYQIDEKEPFDKEIEKLKEKNSNDLNLNELISSYYFGNELVQNARNQMIDKLEYLIYYIINKRFSTFKKYTKELYQEGIVGVLASLQKYDYHKASPSTYFFNYILHQMTDFVNYQINKTSPHYATHITKIKKAINSFEKEGREVTVKDLAQETGISVETIVQSMNIMEKANEMHYETIDILESKMSETFQSPEEEYMKKELANIIRQAVNSLPTDEGNVIILKFGLDGEPPLSYKNISERLGIQIDRIKKLNSSAIRKLKKDKLILENFGGMKKSNKALNSGFVGIVPLDAGEKIFEEIWDSLMEENQNETNK